MSLMGVMLDEQWEVLLLSHAETTRRAMMGCAPHVGPATPASLAMDFRGPADHDEALSMDLVECITVYDRN